ncbi:AraC family transcriptional regulator [Pseudonocardia lacus]|uniref:AraC family transcriptional regulator n=1 Tax=Pseudonocardia lacus TaxID=2835865 RepID=UPI001BDD408C|nr:AraC family transcriptional regulator [Pseudonocardia lacus]
MPQPAAALLAELRELVLTHARAAVVTPVDGLLLSRVEGGGSPEYSLTEPLVVVMVQGGKRLLLGDRVHDYRAGQCLVVTADLPVSGHFVDASPAHPALGVGLVLRPAVIASLLLEAPGAWSRGGPPQPAIAVGEADADLLDATVRLVRLVEHPDDAAVLAPLVEREILWRLLTGQHGAMVRQIGLADSTLAHVARAIRWIRENHAEPLRIAELAALASMSPSTFHRHFRAVTALSPVQFQKRIRLQEARALLLAGPDDVAGIGHLVGYDSPSQFSREYRRFFGEPPGRDAARLRTLAAAGAGRPLP